MSFDDKIKVWLHYVAKQCYINAWLEIDQKSSLKGFPINDFDSFCSGTDESNTNTLAGYYWRFEKEIAKI